MGDPSLLESGEFLAGECGDYLTGDDTELRPLSDELSIVLAALTAKTSRIVALVRANQAGDG
jgi:hypothetical protein